MNKPVSLKDALEADMHLIVEKIKGLEETLNESYVIDNKMLFCFTATKLISEQKHLIDLILTVAKSEEL
jgi:hypothetical protein